MAVAWVCEKRERSEEQDEVRTNMAENKLLFPSCDKSLNFKELVRRGWDAVEIAIYTLLSTPMNTIPEMPSLGFDLHEFQFRTSGDSEISQLENELATKISEVTLHSNISVNVEIIGVNAYITITYQKDNGSEVQLPISIEEGTNGRSIIFKNIIVR